MDITQSTNLVYDRIQKLEPENVSKIIHYLLLQDHGDREMIRLAFAPDAMIHSLINKAKSELGLSTNLGFGSAPYTGSSPPTGSISPPTNRYWNSHHKVNDLEFVQNRMQFLNLENGPFEPSVNHHSVSPDFHRSFFHRGQRLRSPSLPEFPVKVCRYYTKGFCKHGNRCRYFHGQIMPERENFSQMFNPNSNDEDHVISPGSLNRLESEIVELLNSRRGFPVSIASLPTLYRERFDKPLQVLGYVTESQRHGKAGYSLTNLLARLKNNIHVIDRPHGQHCVILAEDHPKFVEYNGERNGQGGIVAGCRQIYLTFPAESTFTEQDVSDYFSKFGAVEEVRIPCHQNRMFGFVTFVHAETAKQILAKGSPHFVCGARVLVKPYREKSRLVDRKSTDKVQSSTQYGSPFMGRDTGMNPIPPRTYRKQFPEQERFNSKFEPRQSCFRHATDDLKLCEDQWEGYGRLLDVLVKESTAEDKIMRISTNYKDIDGQGLNLPDSPFSMSMGTGISTVT